MLQPLLDVSDSYYALPFASTLSTVGQIVFSAVEKRSR